MQEKTWTSKTAEKNNESWDLPYLDSQDLQKATNQKRIRAKMSPVVGEPGSKTNDFYMVNWFYRPKMSRQCLKKSASGISKAKQ